MANYAPALTAQERAQRSVFVGNIPYEATEEQLKDIFAQAGPVVSFRLVYDRETGKPKGYGFCEYQDIETAQSAMRNLANTDFNGRPLRVGVAAGESNKDELKSMQQALGGPVFESPYGDPVEPEKAPEAISIAVASLPPEQMYELMKQMKLCVQNNPNEARNMLLQNPQLAYALLQAQIVMKIVDPQVAMAMLRRPTDQVPPVMPSGHQSTAAPPQTSMPSIGGGPMGIPGANNMMNQGGPRPLMGGMQDHAEPRPLLPGLNLQPSKTGMHGPPQGSAPGGGMGRGRPGGLLGDRPPPGGRDPGPPPGPRGPRDMGGPRDMRDRDMALRDRDMGGPRDRDMGGPRDRDMGGRDPRGDPRSMSGDPRSMGSDHRPMGGDPRSMGGPAADTRDPRGMGGGRGGPPGPGGPPGMRGQPPQMQGLAGLAGLTSGPIPGIGGPAISQQDHEKAALIMQVLQLSDQQISMLPPDQRESIMILKQQISRGQGPT